MIILVKPEVAACENYNIVAKWDHSFLAKIKSIVLFSFYCNRKRNFKGTANTWQSVASGMWLYCIMKSSI